MSLVNKLAEKIRPKVIAILDSDVAVLEISDMYRRIREIGEITPWQKDLDVKALKLHLNNNLGENAVQNIHRFLLMDNTYEVEFKSREYATLLILKYG